MPAFVRNVALGADAFVVKILGKNIVVQVLDPLVDVRIHTRAKHYVGELEARVDFICRYAVRVGIDFIKIFGTSPKHENKHEARQQ